MLVTTRVPPSFPFLPPFLPPQVMLVTTESSMSSNLTTGASAASGSSKGLHKGVLADLEAVGAIVVTFNPVTDANMTKV